MYALLVPSLLQQVWNKLLTTCNKFDGIVARLFQQDWHSHTTGNRQLKFVHSIEVCVSTHIALRISLPSCQPVNCIFWRKRTLNWLVAASKLHNDRASCCTAEWPYCPFPILWHSNDTTILHAIYVVSFVTTSSRQALYSDTKSYLRLYV